MSNPREKSFRDPLNVAMRVLDELDDPDSESSQEDRRNAWQEVKNYIAQLEGWCEERDRYLAELLRKLGIGDAQ